MTERLKRRTPWVAALLSLSQPGLGHIYAGDARAGLLIWLVTWLALGGLALSYALLRFPALAYLGLVTCSSVSIAVYAARAAWRLARRRPDDQPLRPYQRLPVYVLAWLAMAELPFVLLRGRVIESFHMPASSMAPTLVPGDFIFVVKVGGWARPQRGAVVAFYRRDPAGTRIAWLKRLVALEGDQVEQRDGAVLVNGREVLRSRLPARSGTLIVPAGHCYLVGDNADQSADSRFFGPVALSDYIGRASAVWYSPDHSRMGQRL